jgi:catecholate siderophore receptor
LSSYRSSSLIAFACALAAPLPAAAAPSEDAAPAPAEAAAAAEADEDRGEIVVTASARNMALAPPARRPAPTPRSATSPGDDVISESQIEDQGLRSIADVSPTFPARPRARANRTATRSRFAATTRRPISSSTAFATTRSIFRDLYNVDRVEVLRGPNAMIFAAAAAAGW